MSENAVQHATTAHLCHDISAVPEYPRVNVFDPTDIYCDKFFYRGIDSEGRALYRDGDHLSKAGSQHVAEEQILSEETD